jgi:NDP-sugar pyrophosphorylase family protein
MSELSGLTAVILAGGLGTRLRSVVSDRPKILAEIAGRPFLAYLLDRVIAAGVRHAVLCTGYRADQVRATFGEQYGPLVVDYSVESRPLGTGGALRAALPRMHSETVLVFNGDSWCDADLAAFEVDHRRVQATGSLLLTEVDDTSRYGRVDTDDANRITHFAEKSATTSAGWINAGIYLLQRHLLLEIPEKEMVSLEREVFPAWIGRGLYGWRRGGRFLDIGTPESLQQAAGFFAPQS